MDLRKVKKLIELAEESDLAELEVSGSEESVRIVRNQMSKSIVPSEISSQAIGPSLIQGDGDLVCIRLAHRWLVLFIAPPAPVLTLFWWSVRP